MITSLLFLLTFACGFFVVQTETPALYSLLVVLMGLSVRIAWLHLSRSGRRVADIRVIPLLFYVASLGIIVSFLLAVWIVCGPALPLIVRVIVQGVAFLLIFPLISRATYFILTQRAAQDQS